MKDFATGQMSVSRLFRDADGEIRRLAIVVLPGGVGWDAELDGDRISLGAFRDIVAMLAVTERRHGAQVSTERWYWLSFADPDRPKGQQFLGVTVVRAAHFMLAVARTHELGINPGGEVAGQEIPAHVPPPDELLDKLVTDPLRIGQLDEQWGAASREAER